MHIFIFSDIKSIAKHFEGLEKSRTYTVQYCSTVEFKSVIKTVDKEDFFYIDISGFPESERKRLLQNLSRLNSYRYGIIDPKGMIKDVSLLFFNGASDYIGKEVLKDGLTVGRIKKTHKYFPPGYSEAPESLKGELPSKFIPSGRDWKEIRFGQEYTFCMMFIELDHHGELRKNLGEELVNSVQDSFRNYVERQVSSILGKLWIWNEFNGIILFPFDGEKCEAILMCFRMILYRKMICVEDLPFRTLFSFRIALHFGNTVYKRKGDTGTLVSDSINTIFHIGTKFTPPGNLYLTRDVFTYAPEGLKSYFITAGCYENIELIRMKLPI
jgi:hypothetical protein